MPRRSSTASGRRDQATKADRRPRQAAGTPASAGPDVEPEGPPPDTVPGRVVRAHGLWYEVILTGDAREGDVVLATMRGQLKRRQRRTDIVAVGDIVHLTLLPDDEAVIEYVAPRVRSLIRTARHTRDTDQVILANPDQVLFTFAIRDPVPHLRMLDRFLILAELQHLPVLIAVGKMDLDAQHGDGPDAATLFRDYERIYPVSYLSARTGAGIEELRARLAGKITVVAGPSGVGKSSLLNVLDPENWRETGSISAATGKGRHTTVGARLHQIGPETFVADTPGMRALAMHAVPPERLPECYREFLPFLGECFYQDCTHVHEPNCAIRSAVEGGEIPVARYESYVALRSGDGDE